MRPLELALVLAVVAAAVRPWTPWRRSRWAALLLALAAVAVAAAQVVVEGARWQLAPAWVAVGGLVLVALRDALHRYGPPVDDTATGTPVGASRPEPRPEDDTPTERRPRPFIVPLVLLAALSAGLAWSLPVITLPEPSGPFRVGTTTTVVVGADRVERYGPEPGGPRVLPVQVWYPAHEVADNEPAPWLLAREVVTDATARDAGLPGFTLGHLAMVSSHAVLDAPLAPVDGLSLVLYSHGWSGFREIHASQLESLASHGYLVVAADHTYGALATELPHGTIAELDPDTLPSGATQEVYDDAAEQLVATFAADLEAIMTAVLEEDLLGDLVDAELLEGHPVGFIGHSTGGGAAVLTCSRDPRCGAVVGYDPWVEPVPDEVVGGEFDTPLLSLRSEEWVDNDNDVRLRRLHAGATAAEGRVEVAGLRHRDLTLLPLLSPLSARLGLSGPLADAEALDIIDRWTVGFLDHHLRGIGLDPLVAPPSGHRTFVENASR